MKVQYCQPAQDLILKDLVWIDEAFVQNQVFQNSVFCMLDISSWVQNYPKHPFEGRDVAPKGYLAKFGFLLADSVVVWVGKPMVRLLRCLPCLWMP